MRALAISGQHPSVLGLCGARRAPVFVADVSSASGAPAAARDLLDLRLHVPFLDADEAEWLEPVRSFTIDAMMDGVRQDLQALGISMDRFSSERALVDSGAVAAAIERLTNEGHVYRGILEPPKGKEPEDWEPREQLLFRASAFGDDTDRP